MTEKRYSDGTLAKWYYSQTNVISDGDNEYYLRSKESVKDWDYNVLLGTNDLLDELNRLSDENEQLKKDLIDHSALISMLEDYQALKIEETLYNLTGAESEEEFNELYKPYLDKAKKCWKGDWE